MKIIGADGFSAFKPKKKRSNLIPFPTESCRWWNCSGKHHGEWTFEGKQKYSPGIIRLQSMGDGREPPSKGQHIMVCKEWVAITKQGGTAEKICPGNLM